jgi:hypothetical protein
VLRVKGNQGSRIPHLMFGIPHLKTWDPSNLHRDPSPHITFSTFCMFLEIRDPPPVNSNFEHCVHVQCHTAGVSTFLWPGTTYFLSGCSRTTINYERFATRRNDMKAVKFNQKLLLHGNGFSDITTIKLKIK